MKNYLFALAFLSLGGSSCDRVQNISAKDDYVIIGNLFADTQDYVQLVKIENGKVYEDDMPNSDKVTRFKSSSLSNASFNVSNWLLSNETLVSKMQGTKSVGECLSCIGRSDFYIEFQIDGKSGKWQIGNIKQGEVSDDVKSLIDRAKNTYEEIQKLR